MLSIEQVKALIEGGITDAEVTVIDMTGTSDHFEAVVVSSSFVGVSLLQRHQMVYNALGDAMSGPIHALKLKTLTPEQAS